MKKQFASACRNTRHQPNQFTPIAISTCLTTLGIIGITGLLSACGDGSSNDAKNDIAAQGSSITETNNADNSNNNNSGNSVNSNSETQVNVTGEKQQDSTTSTNPETTTGASSTEFQLRKNHPPTISVWENREDTTGDDITINIEANDPDGDALTYSASQLPPGISINAASGHISGQLETPGEYQTVVVANDGEFSRNIQFTWHVSPAVNRVPEITQVANQQGSVGEYINLNITASDADNDPLQFSASNLPNGLSINPDNGHISGRLTAAGNFAATISVSDVNDSAQIQVNWDIAADTPRGLVAWWKFDEDGGDVAIDSSGNGNDGTIINGGFGEGVLNAALEMDGGDDGYVRIPQSQSLLSASSQMTVMAWAYRTAHHNVAILAHDYPYGIFFGFHEFTDETPQRSVFKWDIRNAGDGNAACWTGHAPLNQWFHITGTYDGSIARLYVDGNEICNDTMTGDIRMNDYPLSVSGFVNGGNSNSITDEITGKIDDLRIYNTALSGAEILQIAQQTD